MQSFVDLVRNIDQKIKVQNVSMKFTTRNYKKNMNDIKNKDNIILFVKKNNLNKEFFKNDKNIAIFFKDKHFFFSESTPIEELRMTVGMMIKSDNIDTLCKMCSVKSSSPKQACTKCGNLICPTCCTNLFKGNISITKMDQTEIIIKCPFCEDSDGLKFNMPKAS